MRNFLTAVIVAVAMSAIASNSYAYGLCDLLGCPKDSCGCGCDVGCGCETSCGCETACGCEVGCGCEPACGCSNECCLDGRQFAGKKYTCECDSYVPYCPCTGPDCCNTGCGCGTEVSCGCEPACGCGSCCEPCCPPKSHQCCLKHVGFGHVCWEIVDCFTSCCKSSCGCSGEVYWSEWHNDPPRCCDPCDCYGNFTGPGNKPYRAPYSRAYSPNVYAGGSAAQGVSQVQYVEKGAPQQGRQQVARQQQVVPKQASKSRGAAAVVIRR